MAGVGPGDLQDLAQEFLDACAEALDTIPNFAETSHLSGAPDRRFVGYGNVALDCCDQLTVHVAPITVGHQAPLEPKAGLFRINHVQLIATFARCVPVPDSNGNPPPVAEQEAAGEQINADKWAIWNHIFFLIEEGSLFDRCCDVVWGPLLPLQPNGGCGGSTLSMTVCLDGYDGVQGT